MLDDGLRRVLAIGDVHGEADLLESMLAGFEALDDPGEMRVPVIFLGDIVDRGGQSRQALDLVARTMAERPGSGLLLGNHDEWFLRFLRDELTPEELQNWLEQGGAETLVSYGCRQFTRAGDMRDHVNAGWPNHRRLLEAAPTILLAERFAFVHAGVDPRRPIDAQLPQDCIWIRAPFMNHVGRLSHTIVHGHTPQKKGRPVVTENRISMDTGAVFTGKLSAVLIDLQTGDLAFHQVTPGSGLTAIGPVELDRGLGTVLQP
ncbi:metallophosphoesterase [Jiella sp. M17.18]|uniref:metallophosphoesterase n=1 Tax=Jiella sp. M17.18 TaxID=3234247 RepID=UPI0034E02181